MLTPSVGMTSVPHQLPRSPERPPGARAEPSESSRLGVSRGRCPGPGAACTKASPGGNAMGPHDLSPDADELEVLSE